jgi:hypothetical protein
VQLILLLLTGFFNFPLGPVRGCNHCNRRAARYWEVPPAIEPHQTCLKLAT